MDEWLRRSTEAKPIRETYPDLQEVRLKLHFHDDGLVAPPDSEKELKKSRDQKAVFFQKCRMRECVGGGHDLDEVISDMIRDREPALDGVSRCHGWQDEERVGRHRCLDELRYSIEIDYRESDGA